MEAGEADHENAEVAWIAKNVGFSGHKGNCVNNTVFHMDRTTKTSHNSWIFSEND